MASLSRHPNFERALLAQRDQLNALFSDARASAPSLSPAAFGEFLRAAVAPAVEAAAQYAPAQTDAVTLALYEQALALLRLDMIGPNARTQVIQPGWTGLLPGLGKHIALAPARMAASLSNALLALGQAAEARPNDWIAGMRRAGEFEASIDDLLRIGQVLAWRCGLAHYRASALQTARTLPPVLLGVALNAPAGVEPGDYLEALGRSPWSDGMSAQPTLRLARSVGAFSGFGGAFVTPPKVCVIDGQLVAYDDQHAWSLHADAFGVSLMPIGLPPTQKRSSGTGPFDLEAQSVVHRATKRRLALDQLAQRTSAAASADTLAITTRWSHKILLVGLT